MKKSKGFTLIELLAVIIVLAIVSLISVPQILNLLDKARKSSAEDSLYGMVKSAETYVSNFMLKNDGSFPSNGIVFECSSAGCNVTTSLEGYDVSGLEKISFKGTKPSGGKVTISDNGKVITATNLIINGFTCNYSNRVATCDSSESGNTTTTTKPVVQSGYTIAPTTGKTYKAVVYLDPTNLDAFCNASNSVVGATGTNSGCMKWYAYAETDTTYDLILDHNTTAKVNSYSAAQTQVLADTTNWDSSLNARNIKADEIATITGHPTFKQESATLDWFYLDSNNTNLTATGQGASKYAWIYDYTNDCTSFGCNTADSSTYGYWTGDMLVANSSSAWLVDYTGRLVYNRVDLTIYGVRPVITIQK